MHPVINILGRSVPSYSLCIIAGIAAACPALIFSAKKFNVKIEDSIYSFIYAFIGLVIGAKLFFLLLNIKSIPQIVSEHGIQILLSGGFIIYGGLAGAFLGTYIYCRQFHIFPRKIFSLLITFTPLIQCFGRFGCLFAGCCYGLPYSGRFSININGIERFPIQIISAALDLILFLILFFRMIALKKRFLQFEIYLILYSLGRFCIEFFRADSERGFFGPLSTSQWISIVFFAVGIIKIARISILTKFRFLSS